MKWRSLFFVLAALLQLSAPAYLIERQETTLARGQILKFKTAPIDPVDALRGHYVALSFEADRVPENLVESAGLLETARNHPVPVYATFTEDASGYATIAALSAQKPSDPSTPFLQISLQRGWGNSPWRVDLPFNRFYMEEDSAPRADQAYRQNSGSQREAYALVAIYRENAAIKDLCIEGTPIREYLRTHPAAN